MRQISEELYNKLCTLLTDFEADDPDEDNMSDGEWLDCFYDVCVEIQKETNG